MDFVQLRSYDNYISAHIQLSMLQQEGINCHLKDENVITIGSFLSSALGGIKLMVDKRQVPRATVLLDEADKR